MSTSNIVTEAANNKVLPGDKTGLPWELWQIILSWLSAADLCRVSCVCKTWTELVVSVDSTRWKELYFTCSEWHHPFWPLNTQAEPPSWRLAYRDQHTSTKFWRLRQKREIKNVSCSVLFKKSVAQKSIHVGPGLEHESLRAALSVANDYDRILMHPGIYDEQFEIFAKVPFELIGQGELGSVILNVGVKQLSTSTRMSSLVLRAPWFTSFIVNISSGFLQIDNCIIEDGILCARNPSTLHIRFCTFRHASVILQHINVSVIENCEFSQSGGANIFIEGHPKNEMNWTYFFLKDRTNAVYHQKRSLHRKKHGLKATSSLTSTIQSSSAGKSQTTRKSCQIFDTASHDPTISFEDKGGSSDNSYLPGSHFLGPGRDSLIGCNLQSTYQDSVKSEQPIITTLPPATVAATEKLNNKSEKLKENHTCRNDTLLFPDEKEVCSQNTTGLLEESVCAVTELINQNNILNCNARKSSLGHSSLQPLLEEGFVNSLEETKSCKVYSNEDEKLSMSSLNSIKNQLDSPNVKHSALKKNDRRKSVDSHVGFVLNKNIHISEPESDILLRDHPKQFIVSAQTGSSLVIPSNTETNISKLPPISKGSRSKVIKRQKSVGCIEIGNQDKGYCKLSNNEDAEIGDKTGPEINSCSKDKYVEKLKTCILEINMGSKSQISEDILNSNGAEKCAHVDRCILLENIATSSQRLPCFDLNRAEKHVEVDNLIITQTLPKSSQKSSSFGLKDAEKHVQAGNLMVSESIATSSHRSPDLPVSLSHGSSSSKVSNADQSKNNNKYYNDDAQLVASDALSVSANTCLHDPRKLNNNQQECKNRVANIQSLETPGSEHSSCSGNHGLPDDVLDPQHSGCSGNHNLPDDVLDPQHSGCSGNHNLPDDVLDPQLQRPLRRSQSDDVLVDSDDELSILDEIDDSPGASETDSNVYETSTQTTDSSDVESLHFTDTDEEFSNEESVIMLPHLNEFHMNHSDSSTCPWGADAETVSVNSEHTKPVPVNILEDSTMSSYIGQIHGCIVHQCRMNHSKGGIMISLQAHALISECDISNVGYGIRCIQNSRVVILKNKIHHCQTSGIFMRLAASGLIAGNDIHSNNEAGIDIRKNADPLVQFNQIHHGKRSGVVVLGSGHGHIKRNDIYNNAEAGIYVLYGGNPIISENYIYEGRAAGVAINAGGKGCIVDNVIKGNNWSGVDIRNGSCSLVSGNSIINGVGDGVVVGVNGKGCIENNLISGNAGCGIWMMASENVSVHGNQICNNGHCGVMMLDTTTNSMEGHLDQLLTDVSHRIFSQCSDGLSFLEPRNNFALLQHNNIYSNKSEGILIEINKEVQILYNVVHANKKDGILMTHNAPAIVEGNSVTSNSGNGIVTSTFDKASLIGNGIYDNEKHGVVCRNDCVIEKNDIVSHSMFSVLVQNESLVQITNNRLSAFNMAAVKGEELCKITAVNNKICDGGGGDFKCEGYLSASDNDIVRPNLFSRKNGKNEFSKTDFLTDPPQRPQMPQPPPFTSVPTHHIALVTSVSAPPSTTCEQGSKLCIIL